MGDIFGCPEIILRRGAVGGFPARVTIALQKKLLRVGRISTDIIGVTVTQVEGVRQPQRIATVSKDISQAGTDILKTENYTPYWNTEVLDDISMLTNPLI